MMRWTQTLIPTLRETPKEAEATNHLLLMKAGFIRKLSSGLYSYLPLGFRVLQKISAIIREEMAKAGADELLLPALHPAELWKKTGRFEILGEDKISFKNRLGQEFVLGPTHEEVITDLISTTVNSHRDLPIALYQIQTKFRDELRPRFGIVRTREFIMKDAYSFHSSDEDLDKTYRRMYEAYERIFSRSGLTYKIVGADTGIMGGNLSHEFMVLCPYGEDQIVVCDKCKTSVSCDIAERAIEKKEPTAVDSKSKPEIFDTPNLKTIAEISEHFKIKPEQMVKTIIYAYDKKYVAVCVTGVSDINESKLRKLLNTSTLALATPEEIERVTGSPLGFSGPVGLSIPVIVDAEILGLRDFVTGANQKDKHLRNVTIGRDFKPSQVADIRFVREGDQCPVCRSPYQVATSMEIGHTFKLGTRYSKALNALYRDEKGTMNPMIMGCYGIGVNRILAAAVEEHHDEKGMIWPVTIAPYQVEILTLNESDERSKKTAAELSSELQEAGIDVLYDDRNERAGVKFNDADLIGIPIQAIVSERNLANGQIEIKTRKDRKSSLVPQAQFISTVQNLLR